METSSQEHPRGGERHLRREVGFWLAVAVVINGTIGTGIFKTPAKIANLSGSLGAALLVWVIGGVIALAGALSVSELSAAMPRAGGIYEYLRRAYGDWAAFLVGWTKLTLLIPSAVGSFAKLAAGSLSTVLGLAHDPSTESWIAVGVLGMCAGVNVLGVRQSARQQALITALKYGGVLALGVIGLLLPVRAGVAQPPPIQETVSALGVFAALVSVMWAYDGWADLSSLAGEVKNPSKTLPRALLLGTASIALVYLAANLGYMNALGLGGLQAATQEQIAAERLADATLGASAVRVFAGLILLSCVGACMSSLLTNSRMLVPMATDGLFVRWLGAVSPRTGVPTRAVLIATGLGAVYVFWRSFEQLTDAFVVGYFPFYMLAVAAVFVLRRREPDLPRPFRVPLYPLPLVVFLAGATALLIGASRDVEGSAWIAFAVVGLGLPVGVLWKRFAPAPPPSSTPPA